MYARPCEILASGNEITTCPYIYTFTSESLFVAPYVVVPFTSHVAVIVPGDKSLQLDLSFNNKLFLSSGLRYNCAVFGLG